MRTVIPAVFALALATAPLAAQETVTNTNTAAPAKSDAKTDQGKPVTLSGCLAGGPSSYTLSNVAAVHVAHESSGPVGTG